jgi:hypothetical protein
MTKTILPTGVVVKHRQEGNINVYSQILKDEPIYNEVTLETALRNELRDNLIKLHK